VPAFPLWGARFCLLIPLSGFQTVNQRYVARYEDIIPGSGGGGFHGLQYRPLPNNGLSPLGDGALRHNGQSTGDGASPNCGSSIGALLPQDGKLLGLGAVRGGWF
jgi:hypothetical protein